MNGIGNLLGKMVDINGMVKKYIHKIVEKLSKENNVDESQVSILIQSHEGNEYFYLYIDKKYIRQIEDKDIERYCKED